MKLKNLFISGFLAAGIIILPNTANTSFWDIINPLGINKILAKTDKNLDTHNSLENIEYFGIPLIQGDSILALNLPITPKTYKPRKKIYFVRVTGYSSTQDQTDNTPFITASGTHVRDGVIATNFLPFGTVIRIPQLFGNKTFIVEDRMNNRYWTDIDIWFSTKEMAKKFGVKIVKIEIIS